MKVIAGLKKKLQTRDYNIDTEYIHFINISRLLIVYIIQILYDKQVKLNDAGIEKFLTIDRDLDLKESNDIRHKILKYELLNKKVNTAERIDLRSILNMNM